MRQRAGSAAASAGAVATPAPDTPVTPRPGRRGWPWPPIALALLGLVAVSLAACGTEPASAVDGGDGDGSSACPDDLPGACPAAVPSYAGDIAPVVQLRCGACHAPGGVEANHDFTSYAGIFAERGKILSQLYTCRMPPSTALPLEPAERAALLAWLVCDAPEQ